MLRSEETSRIAQWQQHRRKNERLDRFKPSKTQWNGLVEKRFRSACNGDGSEKKQRGRQVVPGKEARFSTGGVISAFIPTAQVEVFQCDGRLVFASFKAGQPTASIFYQLIFSRAHFLHWFVPTVLGFANSNYLEPASFR